MGEFSGKGCHKGSLGPTCAVILQEELGKLSVLRGRGIRRSNGSTPSLWRSYVLPALFS